MTRFARAKGSKASNLKSPEDSTPWDVMKEQLLMSKKNIEESKNREEAEKQRIENYDRFLKEQRTQKRKATWCDFPEAETSVNVNLKQEQKDYVDQNKSKRKKVNNKQYIQSVPIGDSIQNIVNHEDIEMEKDVEKSKKSKLSRKLNNHELNIETQVDQNKSIKKKNKQQITESVIMTDTSESKAPAAKGDVVKKSIVEGSAEKKKKKNRNKKNISETTVKVESNGHTKDTDKNIEGNIAKKKKKRKNKNKKHVSETIVNVECNDHTNVTNINGVDESIEKKNKKGKNKNKKNISDTTVSGESNDHTNDTDKNVINRSIEKKNAQEMTVNTETNDTDRNENKTSNSLPAKKKVQKKKDGKKPRRKPINDRSFELIINGKEVQLIRFDGFPIMKRDAERLEELKKNMISKGIPKSEVQRTMKLERRRAEKALARLKRDVCYNCRKGGHNLSDCPDLKSRVPGLESTEGICFKCGSTEHRQFECKVQKDKEFRFATCFICKESGHIARQCPDNPKGLYPNGGCCKLCGDVTHLRKDCPTVKETKESSSIKLQTLNDDNIEDIGQQLKSTENVSKKPKKIKF